MKTLFFLFLSALSLNAFSCSFVDSLEEFKFAESSEALIPEKPNFKVMDIERGRKGGFGSCSDAGIITLKVEPEPREPTGYIFSIAQGDFEDSIFTDGAVIRIKDRTKLGEYSFVWLDGNSDEQEPIGIIVKIVAVSASGGRSDPQLLKIENPGKHIWWKFW